MVDDITVDDITVQEFVNAIKLPQTDANNTYSATVSRVDKEGVVWVNIYGSQKETPTASTAADVKRGDVVNVNWRNNKLYIDGNYTNPSAGLGRVADVEESANRAMQGAISAQQGIEALNDTVRANAEAMAAAVIEINSDISALQDQIDGNITTWFYEVDPTTSNPPAVNWTTEAEKENHAGDLYYNTVSGAAWRWVIISNTWQWQALSDSQATEALRRASEAQDTADSKRRVFITTPTPPYDEGDLWCAGANGDILACTTAKEEGQSYSSSDWTKLNKYTDNTRAEQAYSLASDAKTSADGKNKVYRQAAEPTGGTYAAGDIWFDSDDDNKIYRYNGSAWVGFTLGDDAIGNLNANHINAGTIDASVITVSNLDAGNITSGTLNTARLNVSQIITSGRIVVKGNNLSDLNDDVGIQTSSDVSSAVSTGISNASVTDLSDGSAYPTTTDMTGAIGAATGALEDDIADAALTADSYISEIGSDGIRVHDANTVNNSIVIDSTGMEVFKGGTAAANSVAKYGDSARVGKEASNNIFVDTNGIAIKNGANELATFSANSIELGKNSTTAEVKFCNDSLKITGSVEDGVSYTNIDNITNATMKATRTKLSNNVFMEIYENNYEHYPDAGFYVFTRQGANTNNVTISGSVVDGDDTGTYLKLQAGDTAGVDIRASTTDIAAPHVMIGGRLVVDGGLIKNLAGYENTISADVNMYITSNGYIRRSTRVSSKRYKHDIDEVKTKELDPHRLYDIEVKQFKYNDDVITDKKDCRYGKDLIGFIAEQVKEVYPIAVDMNEDGECESWNAQYMIPPMLKLIQEQHEQIKELTKHIEALERMQK